MTSITAMAQSPHTDPRVELFCVDLREFAPDRVFYFTSGALPDGNKVLWRGETYEPMPIDASGFSRNGQGQQATPKLSISNADGFFTLLVQEVGDIVGGRVTRFVTFLRYLDGQAEADPDAYLIKDEFFIERVSKYNAYQAEIELSSALDHEGVQLPARQCLRSACSWRYRRYDGSAFNYTGVQCPYVAAAYFDKDGNSVPDPAQDVCGKRLSDCQARFGAGAELPFGGFPGVGRVRVN